MTVIFAKKHHHHHHQYPYHLHLRCTVVRRTPTSPSSLTTTACSAQSRPRMGRRATHWSSATHSPLEPQTRSVMGSPTPSGLTVSLFSTPKSRPVCLWRFVSCQKNLGRLSEPVRYGLTCRLAARLIVSILSKVSFFARKFVLWDIWKGTSKHVKWCKLWIKFSAYLQSEYTPKIWKATQFAPENNAFFW